MDGRSLTRPRNEPVEFIAGEDLAALVKATGLPKPLLMTLSGYSASSVKLIGQWQQMDRAPARFLNKLHQLVEAAKAS